MADYDQADFDIAKGIRTREEIISDLQQKEDIDLSELEAELEAELAEEAEANQRAPGPIYWSQTDATRPHPAASQSGPPPNASVAAHCHKISVLASKIAEAKSRLETLDAEARRIQKEKLTLSGELAELKANLKALVEEV